MFTFKPTEKGMADKLFEDNNISPTSNSMAVQAINSEDGKGYGYCLFDYKDLTATIIELKCSGKFAFLPECLIKAALNYSANRGAFIAECEKEDFKDELIKLGFKKDGEIYSSEIPKVMIGTCDSCSHKNIN